MGNVSSKDIEYKNYVLSDVGVIELLISYRYKYDDYLFAGTDGTLLAVDGALPFHEEMLLTYVTLDEYIKRCKFDNIQTKMIEMIGQGYIQEEIAEKLGIHLSVVNGRLQTIYKKIVKENEWNWRKSTYVSKLELKTKQCSKCKEELPATAEFYSGDTRNRDGFHSICKMCRL